MESHWNGKIFEVQKRLSLEKWDGWLLYDFKRNNDLACTFLEIPAEKMLTRRFFYFIPSIGAPEKIVSAIEPATLDHLPGHKNVYLSWQELEEVLAKILKGRSKIAMEYSPRNRVPAVSKVDGGTLDLIRSFGVEVVSSQDLLQQYSSVWDAEKLKLHLAAAKVLEDAVDEAWRFIERALQTGQLITEYDVQLHILENFEKHDCISEGAPICAVNEHSADPHYCPELKKASRIKKGDFILIDLWCKKRALHAVYADITRVGFAGKMPSQRHQEIFNIVKEARDTATEFVQKSLAQNKPLMGCEVDLVSRGVIEKAGYGKYFVHRTGHNIDVKDHGNGTHIDNLETQDTRHILPLTCFSIEPGIYLPQEFGVRLEYDVFVNDDKSLLVTGGIQDAITILQV